MVLRKLFPALCLICLVYLPVSVYAATEPAAGSGASNTNMDLAEALFQRNGSEEFAVVEPQFHQTGEHLEARMIIDGQEHTLLLERHHIRADGFRVRVQDKSGQLSEQQVVPSELWTGRVAGQPASRAVLQRWRERLTGTITLAETVTDTESETWNLLSVTDLIPDGNPQQVIVYRAADTEAHDAACPVVSTREPAPHPDHPRALAKDADLAVVVCEIACDTDVEYYQQNNESVDDTVADIEMIIAGVSAVYEAEVRVVFAITEIIVRTAEPDPYGTTNPNALLQAFSEEWRNNHDDIWRDVTHLFTGKDLDGTAIGIAWADGGICNTYYGYSLVQTNFSTEIDERFAISVHEIGHNFDSTHCNYMDNWCRIMCPDIGGCSGGFHSFGPWALGNIIEYAATRECLADSSVTVVTLDLPFSDDFQSSGAPDPTLWTAVDQANNIYGRLELESGDTWGVNELGTVRTRPLNLTGPATLTFKARSNGLPAGQPMRIEYFVSDTWQWVLLDTILALGGSSNPWADFSLDIPAAAAGPFFSLRFSADGTGGDSNDEWHIDDVLIEASVVSAPEVPNTDNGNVMIVGIHPNPFNPHTSIDFRLDRPQSVTVGIYDMAGKLVTVLAQQGFPAGAHTVDWSGVDATGQMVPSGIYLVRLQTGSSSDTQKIILAR